MRDVPLICVCGKSGVGKTTVVRESGLREVISYTTRAMRPGEVDDYDYHFRSQEWMDTHRDKFKLDWKQFGEHTYGATDDDVLGLDVIVITLDSAIYLRNIGVLTYIIWLDGPIRMKRERSVNVANGPELMESVDRILTNEGTVEQLAEELRLIQSSLTIIADAIS